MVSLILPDIWLIYKPDTGYLAGYRISGQIPDIWPDTGYLAGYRISGQIPDIWLDTRYLAGYRISGRIPDIWPYNCFFTLFLTPILFFIMNNFNTTVHKLSYSNRRLWPKKGRSCSAILFKTSTVIFLVFRDQCCRSGSGSRSGRIRTFFSDPDPVKFSGSGSDH